MIMTTAMTIEQSTCCENAYGDEENSEVGKKTTKTRSS
jgi:hypothetical protein